VFFAFASLGTTGPVDVKMLATGLVARPRCSSVAGQSIAALRPCRRSRVHRVHA